mmetsp:Transcript_5874/g.18877  ORF Transcript_5874/g.18877 Transcript_5874/m.18877 type:complete len:264 (+) Transcript_5874:58-849(+)
MVEPQHGVAAGQHQERKAQQDGHQEPKATDVNERVVKVKGVEDVVWDAVLAGRWRLVAADVIVREQVSAEADEKVEHKGREDCVEHHLVQPAPGRLAQSNVHGQKVEVGHKAELHKGKGVHGVADFRRRQLEFVDADWPLRGAVHRAIHDRDAQETEREQGDEAGESERVQGLGVAQWHHRQQADKRDEVVGLLLGLVSSHIAFHQRCGKVAGEDEVGHRGEKGHSDEQAHGHVLHARPEGFLPAFFVVLCPSAPRAAEEEPH